MNTLNSNIDISIVIVNYKSDFHLKNCLNSINNIKSKDFNYEIIVVENSHLDNKLEILKKDYPKVNFFENSGNNGFANGCNLGAKKTNGNFLLFLNPDTIVNQEAIKKMFFFLKENENVGIVSCNQKNNNGSFEKNIRFFPNINTLFGLFRALNSKKIHSKIKKDRNVIYPDWVSGAVVFISKNWFDKINGWNEDYWMYYEDVDLSKKVSDFGGQIALLTNAEIIHNHGGSSRINIKTAAITKTEVLISKHVFINNHFKGFKHFVLQLLVILNNIVVKIISAIFGILFFFVPKLRLNVYLFKNLISYYLSSIFNRTWMSTRAMNHPNKIK